jgi:hypothetical protein
MIIRTSPGLPRALARLNIEYGSTPAKAVWRTVNSMARESLPSKQDDVTAGGQIIVRKVPGWQVWVWTMNDGHILDVLTLTPEPPVTRGRRW